jgi:arylsulfatase A-like enzyme
MERSKDRPFFAFYSMSLCHAETNDLPKPAPVGPNGRYDSYAEMVVKMDERVGRVVVALDRLGVRDKTLIVYLTDNGTAAQTIVDAEGDEYIYEDVVSKFGGREIPGGKATLTDWGTRVPLIVNWQGTVRPGEVSNDLVDVSDILPSLADVANAELPAGIQLDGHSLTGQMRNDAPPRPWVFAEHKGKCFVRNQRWKLYNDGRFYDVQSDPDEDKPLAKVGLPLAASIARDELQRAFDSLNYRPPAN